MQKTLKILQWILTAATVGIVLLLCWQCLDIYLTGNHPENFSTGVYHSPVYSAQIVSDQLLLVMPLLVVYGILALLTAMVQLFWGKSPHPTGKIRPCPPRRQTGKVFTIVRITILCLGILFIILGVMNGGSRDVLIKASNICTECIGLG